MRNACSPLWMASSVKGTGETVLVDSTVTVDLVARVEKIAPQVLGYFVMVMSSAVAPQKAVATANSAATP